MTTTEQRLDERYGRTRSARARRIAVWVTIAIAAVAGSALAASIWLNAADDVDADTTGFALVDAQTVTVSFQFTAPTGRTVACALEAQDPDHGIVGWKVVEYPASDEHARAFTETVPTVAAATTGLVNACWVT